MVDAWFADIDAAMAGRWPAEKLATLKIRGRITTLVETRLDLLARHRESLRRALALLALPTNLHFAARLGCRSAACMWRLAGDTVPDINTHLNTTILRTVRVSSLAVFPPDVTTGFQEPPA